MRNFEVTQVELSGMIENIENHTSDPNMLVICQRIREGIQHNNMLFEVFEHCCQKVSKWYSDNIIYIIDLRNKSTKDSLFENKKTIENILTDIDENRTEYKTLLSASPIKKYHPELSDTKVFIVHGHDQGLKNEVARFLERINLEPIILHEQASTGDTIIEKIEKYSNVGFGIVLYTPCDVGNSREGKDHLNKRTRQNVVFEHGYLIGKLSRQKVTALVKGNVEKPNDVSGIVYVNYEENDGWKMEVARELDAAGYDIDFNLIFKN